MPTQLPAVQPLRQIPSVLETNPVTHVPSQIYSRNPPAIFPEPDEDENTLVQNAQEAIDQLISDKILKKMLRGIPLANILCLSGTLWLS